MSRTLQAGSRVDRYRVIGPLGSGGIASVHRVQHEALGTEHALKVLSVAGKRIEERLLREGEIQARLKHRNVVEVTDVIDLDGSPGLVMEFVRGPSLEDVLQEGPIRFELVDALVPGLFCGVAAAHRAGVVHRDLKPANILLSLSNDRVTPKVVDFGLVKVMDDDTSLAMTRTGATMGTPQYMAPEQIRDAKNVDARVDVFALGTILYELMSGERAFVGNTHFQIFQQVLQGRYVSLAKHCPDLPRHIVSAIDEALNPLETRVQSVEAFWELWRPGEDLEALAAGAAPWDSAFLERLQRCTPVLTGGALHERSPTVPTLREIATPSPSRADFWMGGSVLAGAGCAAGAVLALGVAGVALWVSVAF